MQLSKRKFFISNFATATDSVYRIDFVYSQPACWTSVLLDLMLQFIAV